MAKKRERAARILLSWSKADQARFIAAVERMHALINDFEKMLLPELRRRQMTQNPNAAAGQTAQAFSK